LVLFASVSVLRANTYFFNRKSFDGDLNSISSISTSEKHDFQEDCVIDMSQLSEKIPDSPPKKNKRTASKIVPKKS
jgi:hypothetical protein